MTGMQFLWVIQLYDNLPPSFQEWMIAYVLGKVAQRNEIIFVAR